MNRVDIAKELVKNGEMIDKTKIHIADEIQLLEKYIKNHESINSKSPKDLIRLSNCIDYLEKVNFDITGWVLSDIPIFYSHCFTNYDEKKSFDLVVWDIGEVIPRYLDDNFDEQDENSIDEAIKKYTRRIWE